MSKSSFVDEIKPYFKKFLPQKLIILIILKGEKLKEIKQLDQINKQINHNDWKLMFSDPPIYTVYIYTLYVYI